MHCWDMAVLMFYKIWKTQSIKFLPDCLFFILGNFLKFKGASLATHTRARMHAHTHMHSLSLPVLLCIQDLGPGTSPFNVQFSYLVCISLSISALRWHQSWPLCVFDPVWPCQRLQGGHGVSQTHFVLIWWHTS